MQPLPDLYATLGVPRTASPEELRLGFRQMARRFHPDTNPDPSAAEEFRLISEAHEILSDPQKRAEYDAQLVDGEVPLVPAALISRTRLTRLKEPQIVYALIEIRPSGRQNWPEPPINVCLVIDRSTSMQGPRLDAVKAAAVRIIENLRPDDVFSVVSFSDRPEVVLPAKPNANKAASVSKISTLSAQGGTEILQGLLCGLTETQQYLSAKSVNHLILLTDGRTYGDEDDCLLLATLAFTDGITISGLGIGDEWNDRFLDTLAAATGGRTQYIASPSVVQQMLAEQVRGMGGTIAQRLRLYVTCDSGVTLKSAFRVTPDPQPLPIESRLLRLGSLMKNGNVSVLLEFLVQTGERDPQHIARLGLRADVPSLGTSDHREVIDISASLTDEHVPSSPPPAIVKALDKLTLYQMQEGAWALAEEGDVLSATKRLEALAARLMASGQGELAKAVLAEADQLTRTRHLSAEGRKRIKYGTRALIAPPKLLP